MRKQLLRKKYVVPLYRGLFDVFVDGRMRRHNEEIFLSCDEASIADKLNSVVNAYSNVKFGSYPEFFHSYYRTRITAEGDEESEVRVAVKQLRQSLPQENLVDYVKDPTVNMSEKLKVLQKNTDLWAKVESAREIINKCYQQYSPENVMVCFNGGKDCTAMLHLAATVLSEKHPEATLQAAYVVEPRPFPQVTEFIEKSTVRYNMQLEQIQGPIKEALTELLRRRPHLEAAVMGTRLGDPYTDKQQAFSPTDPDWPRYMRVNPLLDWSYSDVWQFIRQLYLPYCNLYDRGYTSLGSMHNTLPNPLLYDENSVLQRYKPAYMLEDESTERSGRT